MTIDKDTLIAEAIDALCSAHDIDYEEFLMVQSRLASADAEKQTHPAVRSTLEAMSEHLQEASFLFCASFK